MYLELKVNAGLAAADFDVRNPSYQFPPTNRDLAVQSESK